MEYLALYDRVEKAVDEVALRAFCIVFHVFKAFGKLHRDARAACLCRRVAECHAHVYRSVGIYRVVNHMSVVASRHDGLCHNVLAGLLGCGGELMLSANGSFFLVLVLGHAAGGSEAYVVVGNAAECIEVGSCSWHYKLRAAVGPLLYGAVGIEFKREVGAGYGVALHFKFACGGYRCELCVAVLYECGVGHRCACGVAVGREGKLLFCHDISLFGPYGCLLHGQAECYDVFVACLNGGGVWNVNANGVAGENRRYCKNVCLYRFAVAQHGVAQRKNVGKVGEGIFVFQRELLSGKRHKVYIAVNIFHLGEFRCPLASRSDDAVAHEVALEALDAVVELSVVVARRVVVQSGFCINERQSGFYAARVIQALVNPIPYAAACNGLAAFYYVPVFLQVSHGLAHGMGILANEVGLVVEASLLALHYLYLGIHVASEVGVALAVVVAFIVHEGIATRQKSFHAVVGGLEVDPSARLVAQRPEHYARVVAVAQHHALGAVNIGSLPGGVV